MSTVYAKTSVAYPTKAQYSADAGGFTGGTWTDNTTLQAALNAAGASGVLHILAGDYPATAVNTASGLDTTNNAQEIVCHGRVRIDLTGVADHGLYINHDTFKLNTGLDYPENALVIIGVAATKSGIFCNKAATLECFDTSACYRGLTSAAGLSTITKFFIDSSANQPLTVEAVGSALTAVNGVVAGGVKNNFGNNANGILRNVIFSGTTEAPVVNGGTGAVEVTNCAVLGCSIGSSGVLIQNNSTGTVVVKNTLLTRNPYQSTAKFFSASVTDGGGNVYAQAGHIASRKPAIISIIVDDYTNKAYAEDLAALAETYGYRIGWAIDTKNYAYEEFTEIDWAAVRALAANGHEIITHSRHHVNMAVRDALKIEYYGAGATATMTVTANRLQTHVGGVLGIDIDLYDTEFDTNGDGNVDLSDIVAAINETTDYRCVIANSVQTFVPAFCLSEVSGVDIKESVSDGTTTYKCTLTIDPAKLYEEEVGGSISDIESNVPGFSVRSFVYPGNSFDDTAISYIKNYVVGARGGTVSTNVSLASAFNAYKVRGDNPQSLIGTTNIPRNMGHLLEYLGHVGGCLNLYSHKASEYSLENWALIFDELKKSNAVVLLFGDAVEYVRDNSTTADSISFTAQFSANPNYRLKPSSPCIGAGVDVGLTADADGNSVPGAVGYDIGPYSYMPGWTLFDGSMPPLTLSPTAPGDLKQVQCWSKVATAKEINKAKKDITLPS